MENNVESDRNENWMKPQLYRAAWDIENWPDWMKREAGIMSADELSLMREHVALEQELAQESMKVTQIADTPVKTTSLLDTLTTKQLDALLVLARHGWTHGGHCEKCIKPLLFPSEATTDGD